MSHMPLYFPKNKSGLKIEALFLFAVSDTSLQQRLWKGSIVLLFFFPLILKKKTKLERMGTETFQSPLMGSKIVKTAKESLFYRFSVLAGCWIYYWSHC